MEEKEIKSISSLDECCEYIIGHANNFMVEMTRNRDKGIKAAGARARKETLILEKLFKQYRKLSLESVKA